jgi:c-di-GMP-binding flagellar brake protein YcgR
MRERRKFVRLKAPIGVVYNLLKKHRRQRPQASLIEDIGAGGLSLAVREDLRGGDLLEMDIQIPHLGEPVHIVGEVVWFSCAVQEGERVRKAGVRFRDAEARDLKHILEYIHTIAIG